MKLKKFLPFCAMLFLFGMAVPAFAVSMAGNSSTKITASYKMPEITVVVPATAEVIINPYRLPVTIGGQEVDAQIVSTPACIENKSQVPVSVSVSIVGSINEGSNMALNSATTQGTKLTSKRAFLYFEMQPTDSSDPDDVYWDENFNATKHLVVRNYARTKKNIAVLGASGESGCFGAFRLTGDCVARPKQAWTEEDGIDVTISFTFAPYYPSGK